ncbi:type I glyceraldehyde-3-phosphate dehydrogenase [Patescibacteria group bacterium]|nr:type I glyceraldehyde-3-phosphate dehydrogenase [Patescibacteria group bacterium]
MSKKLNVAVNGLGRIGRTFLRQIINEPSINLVAANSRSPIETYAHLIKYDSLYGPAKEEVKIDGDNIVFNGTSFKMLHIDDPAKMPWREMDIDLVIESTGVFRTKEDSEKHLAAGAKRVLISAPAKGDDVVTLIPGVNGSDYKPAEHKIISAASCTTTCLAPICKVLEKEYGIKRGFMTTIHAYTNDQNLHDAPHKSEDLRRSRAAAESIIPTTTGASEAVAMVLPSVEGKLKGISLRVPTPTVSTVDLVCELEKSVGSADDLNNKFREAASGEMKDVLAVSDEPLVSIDYRGSSAASSIDALSTDVIGDNMVKIIAWYDNEWGYVSSMVRLVKYMAEQE